MADVEKLRRAIRSFESSARPSSATSGTQATVDDLWNLIRETSKVLRVFVDELEKSQ